MGSGDGCQRSTHKHKPTTETRDFSGGNLNEMWDYLSQSVALERKQACRVKTDRRTDRQSVGLKASWWQASEISS